MMMLGEKHSSCILWVSLTPLNKLIFPQMQLCMETDSMQFRRWVSWMSVGQLLFPSRTVPFKVTTAELTYLPHCAGRMHASMLALSSPTLDLHLLKPRLFLHICSKISN